MMDGHGSLVSLDDTTPKGRGRSTTLLLKGIVFTDIAKVMCHKGDDDSYSGDYLRLCKIALSEWSEIFLLP